MGIEQDASVTISHADSMRVLLIENDIMSQTILHGFLEQLGITHITCMSNINDALMASASFQNPFDLCLISQAVLNQDDYAFCAALREHESLSSHHTVIIALSGYIDAENKNRALDAGVDWVLVKPFQQDVFSAMMTSALSQFTERSLENGSAANTSLGKPS